MKSINFFKKTILDIIFIPFFYISSYIIPKNKNLVLLGANIGGKFVGNTKYFYIYLNKKNVDFEYFWITKNKKLYKKLLDKGLPVVHLNSLKGIWSVLRANLLVVEQGAKDITGRTFLIGNYNIINTWHGILIKKVFFDIKNRSKYDKFVHNLLKWEFKSYDFIVSTSDCVSENLKTAFLNDNVKIVGYPRNDLLFDESLKFNDYKKELKLDKYKKIFLYAPTHRKRRLIKPFSKRNIEELNRYMKDNNYLFLIKTHPAVATQFKNLSDKSNILLIPQKISDAHEIFIYSDVLITDYSGVMFDFSLTRKPIIFYPFDYKEYSQERGFYYDYYSVLPGPFAENEKELIKLIKKVDKWSKEKEYKKRYKKFVNKFHFYQDGKSSERLLRLIKKHINS